MHSSCAGGAACRIAQCTRAVCAAVGSRTHGRADRTCKQPSRAAPRRAARCPASVPHVLRRRSPLTIGCTGLCACRCFLSWGTKARRSCTRTARSSSRTGSTSRWVTARSVVGHSGPVCPGQWVGGRSLLLLPGVPTYLSPHAHQPPTRMHFAPDSAVLRRFVGLVGLTLPSPRKGFVPVSGHCGRRAARRSSPAQPAPTVGLRHGPIQSRRRRLG